MTPLGYLAKPKVDRSALYAIGAILMWVILGGGFWTTVIYVAHHFIAKYW